MPRVSLESVPISGDAPPPTFDPRSSPAFPPGDVEVFLYPPTVTYALLGALATYYAMTWIAGGASNPLTPIDLASALAFGANFWPLVAGGDLWRLSASIFLHANVLHLGMNSLAVFFLGRNVEAFFGPWKTLFLFLASGIVGSIASAMLTRQISVGASGAVFGLVGVSLAFAWKYRRILPPYVRNVMGMWLLPLLGLNLALGLIVPRVDLMAHLGGLLAGALLGLWIEPDAIEEARTEMRAGRQRWVPGICLWLIVVTVMPAAASIFALRGPDGPVLDPRAEPHLTALDRAEVLRMVDEQLESRPDDPELLAGRAQLLLSSGDYAGSIRDYEALIARFPEHASALNNLAWLLLEEAPDELRNRTRGTELARRAVEVTPDSPYALGTYGTALLRAGDPAAAIERFERALETPRGPEEATDRYLLAVALAQIGRPGDAAEELERAVRQDDASRYRAEAEAALREQ